MVIYLRHPVHGTKVASTDVEAAHDRENGWVDFDPTAKEAASAAPEVPVVETPPVGTVVVPGETGGTPSEIPAFLAPPPADAVVSDLPADFPGRDKLIAAGFTTWAGVADLDNDNLIAINGIGPATAASILKVMNG